MNKKKRNARHINHPLHISYLTLFPIILLVLALLFALSLRKAINDQKRIGQYLRMNSSPTATNVGPRPGVITYRVQYGDSLNEIAEKFNVSEESILWINDNIPQDGPTPDTIINIPPVTGVVHTVQSFETIESIAERYGVAPQAIHSYPYNEFSDDPEFPLTPGQTLIVPGGRMEPVKIQDVLGAFWRRIWD